MAAQKRSGKESVELLDEDATRKEINQLREKDGNNVCADCGASGNAVQLATKYMTVDCMLC